MLGGTKWLLGAAALLAARVMAQTSTACNPMNATCPVDPALGISNNFVFNTSDTVKTSFDITAGRPTYVNDSACFTVAKKGDSVTIQSKFYIFFGSVSVIMQAATGQGIISSIVLESDDLDEVDWEFLGGNATTAETNYFGKGNTTSYDRAIYYSIPDGADPRTSFHNYTVDWTADRIEWLIDSVLVRTLLYADANGGTDFPQTPMNVRLGVWAGGDPDNSEGTIMWAGGVTDYTKGPFNMYVQSTHVKDYSTGASYNYTDHTGSWQSIASIPGNSTVTKNILDPSSADSTSESSIQAISNKWSHLSSTAKVGIAAASAGAGALAIIGCIFICLRQRRQGRQSREAYNALIEKQRNDAYQDQLELRGKGEGGWQDSHATQGEDALGGWARAPSNLPTPIPYVGAAGLADDVSSPRLSSPASSGPRSPQVVTPATAQPHSAAFGGGDDDDEYQGPFDAFHGSGNHAPVVGISRQESWSSNSSRDSEGQHAMPPQQRGPFTGNGGYARF